MAKIHTYHEFQQLPLLRLRDLEQGDILIKKAFPTMEHGFVEKIITGAQARFGISDPEKIKIDNGWLQKSERIEFKNFGSPTAEHAAIILKSSGHVELAESIEGGVLRNEMKNVGHERYVVWRCNEHERQLASFAADIAFRMTNTKSNKNDGDYNLLGAAKSNFKSPYYQQNTTTERYLKKIIDYCYNNIGTRPNVFCSEFVIACYEAGSLYYLGKTAFGTNPIAMSPLVMENILSYSPKVRIIGRIESYEDILFHAVKHGVEDYQKSLGGWFRKPSPNSTIALNIMTELLKRGPSDVLFPVMEHYLQIKTIHIQEFYDALDFALSPPLDRKSTFYEKLITHVRKTGLFIVT
jgi:hypothetical protein